MPGRELEQEPPAEGVADPVRLGEIETVDRLNQIGHVRRERPRWIPARVPVTPQVDGDDMEALGPPLLGELRPTAEVSCNSVHAHDRRGVRVTPLVHVQAHQSGL